MIIYNSKDWLKALQHFHTSYTVRVLLRRIIGAGIFGALVTVVGLDLLPFKFSIDNLYFSVIGILLSLLLVFRTNTAYERFWEGRMQWGALVNHSRNLAVMADALLHSEDEKNRSFFAKAISNFAIALKDHLRLGVDLENLDEDGVNELEVFKKYKHIPNQISAQLLKRLEGLHKEGIFKEVHLLNFKPHHQALLDIAGACERIKKTPIPFSYSFFIKLFITGYIIMVPFVFLHSFGYYTILAVMISTYALMGIQMIGDEIEDPFGLDCNDLPLTQISENIKINVHEILNVPLTEKSKLVKEKDYIKVH